MNIRKFIDITLSYTISREGSDAINTRKTHQPKEINGYRLERDLQPEKNYPFKVGVYKDKNDNQVVIKVWIGPRNIHYYDLQHQIDVLKTMNDVTIRKKKEFPNIHWPKLIEVITDKNMTAVVTDYIKAKPVETIQNLEKQWNYYQTVEKYLFDIRKYLNKKEEQKIKKKTIWQFLLQLPAITTLAMIENPKHARKIFLGALTMIKAVPYFFDNTTLSLVHGDLNYGNIMVDGKDIYLIDVEQTNVSYKEFELVTTLSTLGNTREFKNRVVKTINDISHNNHKVSKRLGFLMLNCEIHNLTWNAPIDNKKYYLKLIDGGLNLINTGKI